MKHKRSNRWFWFFLLLGLLLGVAFLSIGIGTAYIPLKKIWAVLTEGKGGAEYSILFNIRLPRVLLGFAVGGSLSLAGVLLQGMFRNPLVEPYTLGISGGAALGVCLSLVFKISRIGGPFTMPFSGFLGAMLVVFFLYTLSVKRGMLKIQGLLLTGVMISFISSALMMLLMAIARTEDLQGIIYWIMGSLEEPDWLLIKMAIVIALAGLAISYLLCLKLNALALGEDEARHLGIDTEKTKRYIFIIASLLTGYAVSVAGIIGFIGLVVPHFVRILVGHDHRILLACSFLAGAIFLIVCDTLARTIIAPIELPVGIITGILGGTLFIYALSKRKVHL